MTAQDDRVTSYLAGPDFRARCATNLAGFERIPVLGGEGRRHSAVAVCVVAGPTDEACFVITQRAARLRAHAGQFALPGGRVERGEDAVAAALREVHEEVGLQCTVGDVLGVLDDYPTRSGYLITPVVIWVPAGIPLAPDPAEVAAVHLAPIAELDDPEAPRLLTIPESDRPVIQMPVLGHWIHAPTAAVLYQFRDVVVHGRPTRVGHFDQPVWAWQ